MDTSLLLPREKYAEAAKRYGRGPLSFEIENKRQALFYFGANHSRNPDDSQYPALRAYWKKFLETTGGRDRIVLVEGGVRDREKDEESAIINGSEGALITLLAHRENLSIASPDIGSKALMARLPQFEKEVFLLYWFLACVDNFQRGAAPKQDFDMFIRNWLTSRTKRGIWEHNMLSLSDIKQLYKKILGKEFDKRESQNSFINPNHTGTRVNDVARAQSDIRDLAIASEIERYWNEGKSIFAVFGRGHLIIQKPALEAALK